MKNRNKKQEAARAEEATVALGELAAVVAELEETSRIAGLGTWRWDLRRDRFTLSKEMRRLLGVPTSTSELSFDEALATVPAADREATVARYRQAAAAGAPFAFDQALRRADGTVATLHVRGEVEIGDVGQPVRVRGSALDVSGERNRESQQAEQRLRSERDSWMRLLAQSNVMGMASGTRDEVVQANDEFLRITGHSRADLEAGAVSWARLLGRQPAAPRPPASPGDARAQSVRQVIAAAPDILTRKDGSTVPVLAGGVVVAFDPLTWIIFLLDQSDRHRAEAELAASERRYRSLVETTSSIVWVAAAGQGFVSPQPSWERFTGQTLNEYSGVGWIRAIHPDDRESVVAVQDIGMARGEPWMSKGRLYHAASGTYHHVVNRAAPVRNGQGDIVEWIGEVVDVDVQRAAEEQVASASASLQAALTEAEGARREAEAAADRAWRLGRITTAMARALSEDDLADALAGEVLPAVGGGTFFVTQADGDRVSVMRAVGLGPDAAGLLPAQDAESGAGSPAAGPSAEVLRDGRPVFLSSAGDHAARYPGIPTAWAGVPHEAQAHLPLIAEGRVIGGLHLGFDRRRAFGEAERVFLTTVAALAAQAVQRTRLIDAERAARRAAEDAARRLRQVQGISDIALSRLPIEDLVEALRARLQAILDVDLVRIYVLDDDRTHLRLAAAPEGDAAGRGFRVPLGHGFTGRIGALRRPVVVDDASTAHIIDPGLFDKASLAGVPLLVADRLVGVLHVSTVTPRDFTDDDVVLLELAAERIAVAIDRSRAFEAQRRMARTLQAALLPPTLPAIPGVNLAARYVAAGEGTDVGGDFYDVFRLTGGAWLAIVGDVCGRGPEAAAMTGLARHSVRAVAQETDGPAEILGRLNAILADEAGDERFATAVCARLEPRLEGLRVTLASGGHCRPVLLRAGGGADPVEVSGTMLGPFRDVELPEVTVDLRPGDSLMLYTDGVVEAQGQGGLFGEERLVELLGARAELTGVELAGLVEEAVWAHSGGGPADDLALLVLQVVPRGIPTGVEVVFDRVLPLGERAPRVARRAVDVVLGGMLSPERLDAARLAVSELVTNAVIHGLERVEGPRLRILTGNGMIRLEVRNRSIRFAFPVRPAGPTAESGRGLDVVRAVATSAGIDEEGPLVSVWCTFETEPVSGAVSGP